MENSGIIFSIVIPTFNRADKLRACLESVQQQTCKAFEVIVCDDGSTDHSQAVVEAFKSKGLNINYIYAPNWGGPARPRNMGIAAAQADWVCFLDSDDSWYKDKLAKCMALLNDTDLVYHDLDMELATGRKKRMRTRQIGTPAFIDLLVNGNAISTSTACVRKSLLLQANGFSEDKALAAVEDYDLWVRLAAQGCRFRYLPESLGNYWAGGGHITTKDLRQINRIHRVFEPYLPLLSQKDREYAERMRAYKLAKVYHQMADYKQAISGYKRSMWANNTSIRLKSVFFMIKAALKMGA
jgi:glycosyltransferase involved in cell wall biosynthesis